MFSVKKAICLSQWIIGTYGKVQKKTQRKYINYTKLVKLVYFCDREMLREHNRFITGDKMYSMPLGPVPSKLYSLIKEYTTTKIYKEIKIYDEDQFIWNLHMSTEAYNLFIKKPLEDIILDEEELKISKEITDVLGLLNWKQLVDLTHEFLPEWNDPQGSPLLIPQDTIISALG